MEVKKKRWYLIAEDSFKGLLFGFILVGLFSFLLLSAVKDEGSLYGKDVSLVTAGALDISGFNESVTTVQEDSQNFREAFEKQSVWSSIAGVVVSGIFGLAKGMVIMIFLPFILVSNVLVQILHVPIIVIDVIAGLVELAIIFGIWSLIKIGN